MSDLDALESESVHILREACNRFDKLALMWSLGKDCNVLVWLARKPSSVMSPSRWEAIPTTGHS